jgi:hypothetical protein
MKTQAKDAVAMAMDWLAQLREEDVAGPPPGDGQPATDSAPPAGDFGNVPPAAPPAADFTEPAPPVFTDPDPAAPPTADGRDVPAAVSPAVGWGDAVPAAPPATDLRDEDPSAPLAGDSWPVAAPPAAAFTDPAPAAPPAAGWGDAAPPATESWWAAEPPAGQSWWPAGPSAADSRGAAAGPSGTAPPGRAGTKAHVEITERAVIGDELRIPVAWCEMGACISHYADPGALGEADIRARAIEAGWRADALDRLACPQCQQGDSWFWTAHPAVLWDRDTAVAMTTLMAAAVREIAGADGAAGAEPGAVPSREPAAFPRGEPGAFPGGEPGVVPGPRPETARPPGRGRHRGHPAHADRAQ